TIAQYSGAATTGTVTGQWKETWIGDDVDRTNGSAGLYLVLEDSAGKSKVVAHPDPVATTLAPWQQWRIPLSEFTAAGVKMTAVKKLTIGVGDRNSPKAGSAGTIFFDDIGFGKAAQ
ncbi:MAG: hypothetical protein MUC88_29515, partial [Planctomycetes bacterium]|nr:hypothetical protein [Planctomycetota bacterium]